MNIANFENHQDLCEYMIDKAQDGIYTVAVLFYEDALKLMREFMLYDDVDVESIDIAPSYWDGYEREYYVSLTDDMMLCIEKAYANGKYLFTDADLTLVDGNASCLAINGIPEDKCKEIYIGESDCDESDDYEDEDFDKLISEAKILKDEDGNAVGISLNLASVLDYLINNL